MEIKERNKAYIAGKAILTATKAGTRKFGPFEEIYSPEGKLIFRGRPVIDPGGIVAVVETDNIICDEGLLLMAGFIRDEDATYNVGITYCEIGTDATAPVVGDTTLGATHHRNAVTNDSRALYVVTFATFFTAGESTCFIKEAGVWGRSDAGAANASGLMFAHWLASFDNSGGAYDITITYILTITRG